MLNFNKKDAHVYPFDESPGAGIIMDVDLEQMIRESERLRVWEAILHSKNQRDALEAILGMPRAIVIPNDDAPEADAVSSQEADHA